MEEHPTIIQTIEVHQRYEPRHSYGMQASKQATDSIKTLDLALALPHFGTMSDYNADILEWSEHQVALLRRAAAGERVNDLDWPNIIEEIESVGNEQLHAVSSLLLQALVHMLKAEAWPLSCEVPHWQSEARRFRIDATNRFSPSMRQRIDLARIYQRARHVMPETIDGQVPLPVPDVCPVTLDELLSDV